MPRPSSNSMAIVKDFWAEPAYASLLACHAEARPQLRGRRQRHGAGSLDGLVEDWTEVFEDEGKN